MESMVEPEVFESYTDYHHVYSHEATSNKSKRDGYKQKMFLSML